MTDDRPFLRTISEARHSDDGELLCFTLQFTDGSESAFEAHASDFTGAMALFSQCQISARKAREPRERADHSGAFPEEAVVIDPTNLGLVVGPDGLPYFVIHRTNEPPLGIRLTPADARRTADAFDRLVKSVERTRMPKK